MVASIRTAPAATEPKPSAPPTTRSPQALVYVSSARQPFSTADLSALLRQTRRNNLRDSITGMLLYASGNFLQVLEGDAARIAAAFERIRYDQRHKGILVLWQGAQLERQFPDWSMAFNSQDSLEMRAVPGFSDFLTTPLSHNHFLEGSTKWQKLLQTFKRNAR